MIALMKDEAADQEILVKLSAGDGGVIWQPADPIHEGLHKGLPGTVRLLLRADGTLEVISGRRRFQIWLEYEQDPATIKFDALPYEQVSRSHRSSKVSASSTTSRPDEPSKS
jgi:hypothetical protein